MLRESRPMPGRNFATLLLLVVALVGCGGEDAPAGIRVRDYTVHSQAVDRDMGGQGRRAGGAAGGLSARCSCSCTAAAGE